jgi:hypothetical protein
MDLIHDSRFLFGAGLVVVLGANWLVRYVKNRRSPYHTQFRDRRRRLIRAEQAGDYRELQQILLECKWVEIPKSDAVFSHAFGRMNYTQQELEADRSTIYAGTSAECLQLPNADNLASFNKYKLCSFFNELVLDYRKALAASEYNGNFFFPERILPYPKVYLLFVLDHLIAVDYGKDDYVTLREYLTENCIGLHPKFLPVDREQNKQAGEAYLAALK